MARSHGLPGQAVGMLLRSTYYSRYMYEGRSSKVRIENLVLHLVPHTGIRTREKRHSGIRSRS